MSQPLRGTVSLLLLILLGCGDGPQPTYPVTGELTIRGRPAADADLRFYEVRGRTPGMARPYATTDAEGRFTVSTYGMNDGAPPGEYRVSVSWKGPLGGVSPDQRDAMPERLLPRYNDPTTLGRPVRARRRFAQQRNNYIGVCCRVFLGQPFDPARRQEA